MMRPLVGLVVVRTSNQLQRFCTAIAGTGRKLDTHFRTQKLAELMGSQVGGWGHHTEHPLMSRCEEVRSLEDSQGVGGNQDCNHLARLTLGTQEVPELLVCNPAVESTENSSHSYLQGHQLNIGAQILQSLVRTLDLSFETFGVKETRNLGRFQICANLC